MVGDEEAVIYFVSDDKVPRIWNKALHSRFQSGQSAKSNKQYSLLYLNHLKKNNIYRNTWEIPDILFGFIYSKNVIKNITELSSGCYYIFHRVECYVQDKTNSFLTYVMVQPKEDFIKEKSKALLVEEYILDIYNSMMNTVVCSHFELNYETFFLGGLVNNFQNRTLLNLIYLPEIDFPCILLPEYITVTMELQDQINILNDYDPLKFFTFVPSVRLLHVNNFSEKENVGEGANGSCFAYELNESSELPYFQSVLNQKFIGKKIKCNKDQTTKESNSNDFTYAKTPTSRTIIVREAAKLLGLFLIKNCNLIKPFVFSRFNDSIKEILMLYDIQDGKLDLISTMEYIDGTDLLRILIPKNAKDIKLYIVVKLAEALYILHENRYAHTDLHDKNIRLQKDSYNPIILDLGSCEKIDSSNTTTDIKSYFKIIRQLYGFKTIKDIEDDVPKGLKPFFSDVVSKQFNKYKSMSQILESFSAVAFTITLGKSFLDYKYYIKKHRPRLFNLLAKLVKDLNETITYVIGEKFPYGDFPDDCIEMQKQLYKEEKSFASFQTISTVFQRELINKLFA